MPLKSSKRNCIHTCTYMYKHVDTTRASLVCSHPFLCLLHHWYWYTLHTWLVLTIALAAGAIFSSKLPALMGMYCKIYPQLYWNFISQSLPVELDLYGKILPSWLSNTGDLNFNIIMFSNWESLIITGCLKIC